MKIKSWLLIFILLLLLPVAGHTDPLSFPVVTMQPGTNGSQSYSINLQILIFMTLLTVLPGLLMAMTSFTRIIIVLSILRQAIGMAQTPTNQILIGIALFMTYFVMSPVFNKINETAIQPYMNERIDFSLALSNAQKPLRQFMLNQTRKNDLSLFEKFAHNVPKTLDEIPMSVLIPAFITSELKTAFQIGFILFLPFLIIDLVVSSLLMAMGMMMLSPLIISLPFKIMLFVMVDGWTLVLGSLASSFALA
ncbi:TPA: flagellar type III secretion system pore protein FliP [Legionella pneumophila]|uniref:Flagellar biosynthetic protein FliP n=1 Tax=Legionella pneumophila (strain Lens) TaxID=297245 RepID=Q3V7F2_LEGPL|nr:flagellar type III secretion system pore protein FliP [Legionella pneumophila]AOW51685.1 flagellar biosynthetic protein FliP [Legionella pneumophila subsp. pneumophila]AOW54720.1 flagellar biosynthetic protein FliP [Legionella pneumophila subsp. pneumophila]AOW56979.1 flagellar biosynthetic protein FliP [Legionella pneumophila subsp. pneumophila]AOW60093.1 flagellar biosynthetic protein FliP [Legionella pneumophila subsp. pneumophila]AOW65192.1 flagellar biosynthetic protein FliP [Legionell